MKKIIWLLTTLFFLVAGCQPAPSLPSTPTPLPPTATPSPEPPVVTATYTSLPPTDNSTPTANPPTPRPNLPVDPAASDVWKRSTDGMTMVYIPAGEFVIGSEAEDPCAHLDEQPKHKVYLNQYWIDQTEVTNAQYQKCVKAGMCVEPASCGQGESTYQDALKSDYPVTCLTWDEVGVYCGWVGGRLPTEAQWEKAARGTAELKYPWGNEFESTNCNSEEGGIEGPMPVGSYSLQGNSPYGLMDVSGNVWEWTADWYDIGYYSKASSQNPTGPKSGEHRSLRGGSWYANYCSVRTSYRYYDLPYGRSTGVGFRCVVVP